MPASHEQSPYQPPQSEIPTVIPQSDPTPPSPGVQYFLDHNRVRYAARFVHQLPEPVKIRSPQEAGGFLRTQVYHPWEAFTQEEMVGLALNTHCEITHSYLIYRGTLDMMVVRPIEIFRPALLLNASAILLGHQHPSSDPSPSPQDIAATKDVLVTGEILGIPLIDHLIVGRDRCVSLKERGLAGLDEYGSRGVNRFLD